jgi:hypothetical protein
MSWISILNAGMLIFLVFSELKKYGIDIRITDWYIPFFLFTLLMMILLGYLEDKLGFYDEENKLVSEKNPYFTEIMDRLDRIERKISKK